MLTRARGGEFEKALERRTPRNRCEPEGEAQCCNDVGLFGVVLDLISAVDEKEKDKKRGWKYMPSKIDIPLSQLIETGET